MDHQIVFGGKNIIFGANFYKCYKLFLVAKKLKLLMQG